MKAMNSEFLIRVIQTKLGQKFTPNSQLLPFIASFDTKKTQTSFQVSQVFLLFLLINNEHRSRDLVLTFSFSTSFICTRLHELFQKMTSNKLSDKTSLLHGTKEA